MKEENSLDTPLLALVRVKLETDPRTYQQISTAAGVGLDWIKAFKWARISDPSVRKIEKLAAVLGIEVILKTKEVSK